MMDHNKPSKFARRYRRRSDGAGHFSKPTVTISGGGTAKVITPEYLYGVYFPETQMSCDEFGERSQGGPPENVEWLDD